MKKIGELQPKSADTITIYYDDKADTNNYRVYREWNDIGPYGIVHRRKQIARFADLYSCVIIMSEHAKDHNEERR